MLLIDAANVVGSSPTGSWRDRAGGSSHIRTDACEMQQPPDG